MSGCIRIRDLLLLLALATVLSTPTFAVDAPRSTTTTLTAYAVESINATQFDETATAEIEATAREFGIDINSVDINLTVIIVGENLDAPEKAAFAYAKTRYPEFFANTVSASEISFTDVENSTRLFIIAGRPLKKITVESSDKSSTASKDLTMVDTSGRLIVLLGGPAQNTITSRLLEMGMLNTEKREMLNQMVVADGKTGEGIKVVVISDKRGFANLERKAASYSPLVFCLPLQWIPIAASIIGAVLMSILNLLKGYIESIILDLGKKGYGIHEKTLKIFGVKVREVLAVIAASIVLGLAVSWTFAGPTVGFIGLLLLNTLLCFVGGISHEVIHWAMAKILKIKTEYRFWLSGSIMTVITSFLGNSFGLQGFLIEEVEKDAPRWKTGLMKLSSPVFSTIVMVIFAATNFFLPHVVFQMVYSIAGMLAMVEILPFQPMDGYEIRKWNILIWLIAFIFILVSFIATNFII